MGYSNTVVINAAKAAVLTGSENDSKFKLVVPSGVYLTLHKVIQRCTTQLNTTGSPALKVIRTPSGGSPVTTMTCSAWATGNTVGTVKVDATPSTADATFDPGDTLDIQLSTVASTAGAVDIDLVLGFSA